MDQTNPSENFEESAQPLPAASPVIEEPAVNLSTPPLVEPASQAVPRRPKGRLIKSFARYLVVWLGIFLILKFIIPSYDVKGSSMVPTYQVQGDRVLTDQLFFKLFGNLTRGEIIVLERNEHDNDALIKRVIGLPGEKLQIKKGQVFINDRPIDEPYIQNKADYDYPPTQLKSDCYFVLGDNRPVSLDSHYFGCISREQILAKVILRYPWHF